MGFKHLVYRVYSNIFNIDQCKMVIVVRRDLPMTPGKIASQCAHAAVECYRTGLLNKKTGNLCQEWILAGQPKIVLKTLSRDSMLDLYNKANGAGLITAKIVDAGATQVSPGTVTTIGIGPGRKKEIDEITSHLKIL